MTSILAATAPALPRSSCKVRQSTAATTIGVGKIEPELGAWTTTMGSSLPDPAFADEKARHKAGFFSVQSPTKKPLAIVHRTAPRRVARDG